MWDVWNPLGLYLNQKVLKLDKKLLSCGQFTNRRLLTPVGIMWDVWDPFRLHLNPKDLKSGKKRLSYGQYTNGRLRDSSECHAVCMRFIRASLEQKRSKMGQETAELRPIYQWEVARLHHFTPLVLNLVYPDKLIWMIQDQYIYG